MSHPENRRFRDLLIMKGMLTDKNNGQSRENTSKSKQLLEWGLNNIKKRKIELVSTIH